jgi:hypothetical protein
MPRGVSALNGAAMALLLLAWPAVLCVLGARARELSPPMNQQGILKIELRRGLSGWPWKHFYRFDEWQDLHLPGVAQ